jgi:mono/diheme cytochrome c family protein
VFPRVAGFFLVFMAAACGGDAPTVDFSGGDAARGANVAALAGGCGCHTEKAGPLLAGGKALPTPFGNFYTTNITNDTEAGIGSWSAAEIERAIRVGTLPDGTVEAPAMPYYRYAGMADDDVRDLIAWLRAIPPSDRRNTPHDTWLPAAGLAMRLWRTFFTRPIDAPQLSPAGTQRGRYLVESVAICGDCHTPRNLVGAPKRAMFMAGATGLAGGETAPNITPDRETGLGDWDEDDIVSCLEMGMLPNMDTVQGLMEEMIDGVGVGTGYANAELADIEAIAHFIKGVPAIHHTPGSSE